MDNKRIGFAIIFLGILFASILSIYALQVNHLTDSLMQLSGGSCFDEQGNCIHKQSSIPLVIGVILVVVTLALGVYLVSLSKSTQSFESAQKNILETIRSNKKNELKEGRFNILLEGLDEDEKKVLVAIKEQDGISQSTLRYRTDLSKSKLSMVLSQLEKKNLISKVRKGKINEIFMKKAL